MSTAEPYPSEAWIPQDTFGARLALVRQAKRWNRTQAAHACGLSDESWRQWERGTNPQKLHDVARKIADGSGCDYTWLVMGSAGGFPLRREDQSPELVVITGGKRARRPIGDRPFPQLRLLQPADS